MNRTSTGIALAAFLTSAALAQTPTTAKRPVAHRSSTASAHTAKPAAPAAAAANPADTPPNVPKVEGTPKPLYSLRYIDTVVGTGELSVPRKWYLVRYTGWLTDGTKFDSSDDHPGAAPFPFPYGAHQVITGWDTGFEGMHVGGKRRIFIPYQLAYGESGRPPVIPAKADLIFDMELVSMSDTRPGETPAPTAPAARPSAQPADPARPAPQPADPTKPTSSSPAPSSNPSTPQSTSPQPK